MTTPKGSTCAGCNLEIGWFKFHPDAEKVLMKGSVGVCQNCASILEWTGTRWKFLPRSDVIRMSERDQNILKATWETIASKLIG